MKKLFKEALNNRSSIKKWQADCRSFFPHRQYDYFVRNCRQSCCHLHSYFNPLLS